MSDDSAATTPATPKHLWAVGILGVLWNSVGAFDYLMTQTENASYMSQFTPEQLEFFYGFPAWLVACWAIAVWGGVVGALLLLMKKKLAVPVLMASFLAMVVTTIHNYFLTNGLDVMGSTGAIFGVLIFAIGLALWLYARAMGRRGVLT